MKGKAIIHVNQHIIKRNTERNEENPPLTVKMNGENHKCHEILLESARIVHRPFSGLACGARVWIETDASKVRIVR